MLRFKHWLTGSTLLLAGVVSLAAFTANDAATIFNAYNNAFLVGGYYPGWWTGAEEIEMAEDAYDNSPTPVRQTIVANACNQFISHQGASWSYNEYNDDISWAVIALARGYLITGNPNFREVAKANWDAMYRRAWDTNFAGGGLWWRTDNQYKNAAVNGPATIAACLLHQICGDDSYLDKAQAIYAWERRALFQTNSGAIYDGLNLDNTYNTWASTYNQGTFIGAANFLQQATGLPAYSQDAILAANYTRNNIASAGILPEYPSNSDLSGFTGIFARWMARFAKDQNLWPTFGPWLTLNANAAWSVRNSSNLAWQKWKTATPATPNSEVGDWGCSASVVILQVADPSPADALQISPTAGFTAVAQRSLPPQPTDTSLMLTNTGTGLLNWSLASTATWLSVSTTSGALPASGQTNVTVSLIPSAIIHLPSGRYAAGVWVTNLTSGASFRRRFTLVVSGGNIPLAASGYNARILAPNTASAGVPRATPFDLPNNYCFYQAGLNNSSRGLPPDGTFTSQWDKTTVFQFQPYGSTNALVLGGTYPGSATLTLAAPRVYNSISLLACSANGGGSGTGVLHFTDGTSRGFSFIAQDWFNTTANVAIQAYGRLKLGASFGAEDNGPVNPNLYQTTLNLAALGLTQPLASITFVKPAGAGAQQTTGIFAISGSAAYQEPVITQQPGPTNLYRFSGSSLTWTVTADAALPVIYSWQRDGTSIPTATSASLSLTNLQTAQSGNYAVVVSNSFGAVTSSIVALAVVPAPAYPFGQAVLADGALGYWQLNETSGNVAHDYLTGNHGRYTPTVLLGQPGYNWLDTHKSARFGALAASGSCVTNIAVDFATSGNAAFSVEAWVNGGAQTTDAGLVTKGYGSGGEQFNLDCGGGNHGFRFFVRDASGGARVAGSSIVPNNQWHHLVGVCDQVNGLVRLYVDGVNVAQTTITPNSGILSSAAPVSIGSRQAGFGTAYNNQFVGSLEEVAIYGYALSPAQVQAHYQTATNRPPGFPENPFTVADANVGQSYSGTLVTHASDPNGDPVSFAKNSGPTWLNVTANGGLSGTPIAADAGLNTFVVRATDASGLFSAATMNLEVLAAPAIATRVEWQGNRLLLSWTGGLPPYQVQHATNLANPVWQNLGAPVNTNNWLLSPTNVTEFFRVFGQ